jgi:hypothetical protein
VVRALSIAIDFDATPTPSRIVSAREILDEEMGRLSAEERDLLGDLIVRHLHDGAALAVELVEHLQYLLSDSGIEAAGWLVSQGKGILRKVSLQKPFVLGIGECTHAPRGCCGNDDPRIPLDLGERQAYR